jgi:hypothetical protein
MNGKKSSKALSMESNKQDWFKQSLIIFLAAGLPIALVMSIFLSLPVGLLFGSIFGLFMAMHLSRNLQTETFEITIQNKDHQKGFAFYEAEIISIMHDMRYELILDTKENKIWQPRPRARVMGGKFTMQVSPYSITITGPRGIVRIVTSMLDIQKIFI